MPFSEIKYQNHKLNDKTWSTALLMIHIKTSIINCLLDFPNLKSIFTKNNSRLIFLEHSIISQTLYLFEQVSRDDDRLKTSEISNWYWKHLLLRFNEIIVQLPTLQNHNLVKSREFLAKSYTSKTFYP